MKAFVDRIRIEQVKLMVEGMRLSTIDAITVLSDTDPDDEAQMLEVANKLFSDGPFRKGSRDILVSNIAKIPQENVKEATGNLVPVVYDIALILTDKNPKDGDQIKEKLKQFLTSEEGLETYVELLTIALPAETAVSIGQIILTYLAQIWEEQPEVAAEAGLPEKAKIFAIQERMLLKQAA